MRSNAIRLVRHVWEFELEMTWVLAEPDTRIERWAVVITTGTEAYRRQDGIAVVPAGLLGP